MRVLLANYKNELCKLFAKKKYIVLLIIAAVICSFNVIISRLIELISKGIVPSIPSDIAMGMIGFFAEIFIPLVVFMAVTDLFSTEMHMLTIKAVLMRPISRMKIIISKALAAFTMGVAYFGAVLIMSSILEIIFGSASTMFSHFGATLLSYLVDLVPLLVLTLLGVLINMLCKGSTLSMLLCIALYAAMKYCYYFIPSIGNALFTAYMQWHKLWVGSTLPFGAMASKIGLLVGSGIILFTGSCVLFDKKEF